MSLFLVRPYPSLIPGRPKNFVTALSINKFGYFSTYLTKLYFSSSSTNSIKVSSTINNLLLSTIISKSFSKFLTFPFGLLGLHTNKLSNLLIFSFILFKSISNSLLSSKFKFITSKLFFHIQKM